MPFYLLSATCVTQFEGLNLRRTHKSHIKWTAESTDCHRIQYSIFRHFTALFCRN